MDGKGDSQMDRDKQRQIGGGADIHTSRRTYEQTDGQTRQILAWGETNMMVIERQDIKGNKTIHGNEYSKSISYTSIRLISFATDVGPQNISRFHRFNN